jgi:hypothetical protein
MGLLKRYDRLAELAGIEDSISNLQWAVQLFNKGHPYIPMCLSNLGSSLLKHSERLGALADIQDSISNSRVAVQSTKEENPNMPASLVNLGVGLLMCYERLGDLDDIEDSISIDQSCNRASSPVTRGIQRSHCLHDLGLSLVKRFERSGELVDLEDAISRCQTAVQLTDPDHPDRSYCLSALGDALDLRFQRLSDPADLAGSISFFREAAQLKTASPSVLNGQLCPPATMTCHLHWMVTVQPCRHALGLHGLVCVQKLIRISYWLQTSRILGVLGRHVPFDLDVSKKL